MRYHNYNHNAPIFYLSLFEKNQPSDRSIKDINNQHKLNYDVDYVCISYENDIINWLNICLEKSVDKPILRETIKQYIYLIRNLTSQTMNEDMKKEIIELITKEDDYFHAAEEIYSDFDEIKKKYYYLKWKETIDKLIKGKDTKEIQDRGKEYKSDLVITINIKGVEHYIVIGFEDENVYKVYISLRKPSLKNPPDHEIIEKVKELSTNGKFENEKLYFYEENDSIDYCAIYCDIKKSSDIYSKFVNVLFRTFEK